MTTTHGPLTDIAEEVAIEVARDYLRLVGPIPAARCSSAQARGQAKRYAYWGAVEYAVRLNKRGEMTAVAQGRAKSIRRSRKLAEEDTEALAERLGGVVVESYGPLTRAEQLTVAQWVEAWA